MLHPGRSLSAAAAWVVVFAVASPALAARAPAPLKLVVTSAVLAGEMVKVSWDALDEPGFDEMELVFSLDGGRTWPIRLTGDLSPGATETTFRIPALPAEAATVALRAGWKGEREREEVLAESVPFRVRVRVFGAGETLQQVRGEWRTVEAMDGQTPDGPIVPESFGLPTVSREGGDGPDADDGGNEDLFAPETESPVLRRSGTRISALGQPTAAERPQLLRRE